jgi:hypothetical protein
MATEKLKFKLELYATMWDKAPHAEVLIDDKSYFDGDIKGTEDKPDLIEFEHELEEGKSYQFIIKRTGKGRNQTVINDQGDILKDQLLHIKNIEIDEIDIGTLVYEGVYTPEYPEPWATQQRESGNDLKESFKNVTQMGFNGTWSFKFTSPFYMWLLENLY